MAETPKMKATAVYMRVSTDSQDVRSQRLAIERYLSGNGIEVPQERWYIDPDTGGGTMVRRAFAELQAAIFCGEVGVVVFFSIDRFARTLIDGLVELDRWQRAGVRIVFVSQHLEIDPSSWMGNAILQIMVAMHLAFAEAERERISVRRKAGMEAARKDQAEARKLYAEGQTFAEIGAVLGRDPAQVQKMVQARPGKLWFGGLHNLRPINRKHIDMKTVAKLIHHGLSQAEIGRVLMVSESTIARNLREAGGTTALLEKYPSTGESGSLIGVSL